MSIMLLQEDTWSGRGLLPTDLAFLTNMHCVSVVLLIVTVGCGALTKMLNGQLRIAIQLANCDLVCSFKARFTCTQGWRALWA